jgi:hypothetical protein
MKMAKEYLEKGLEEWRTSKDVQVKREAQTNWPQVYFWAPGAVCTKMATQVTYALGFGWSLYGWKAKKISFQMAQVPCPTSSGVDGNMGRKDLMKQRWEIHIWRGRSLSVSMKIMTM